jgi:hypothetical protein
MDGNSGDDDWLDDDYKPRQSCHQTYVKKKTNGRQKWTRDDVSRAPALPFLFLVVIFVAWRQISRTIYNGVLLKKCSYSKPCVIYVLLSGTLYWDVLHCSNFCGGLSLSLLCASHVVRSKLSC